MNHPARIPTLASAEVPVIQYDNAGAIVTTQSLARDTDSGRFLTGAEELRQQLDDESLMGRLRDSGWRQREQVAFDDHADHRVEFFRSSSQRADHG